MRRTLITAVLLLTCLGVPLTSAAWSASGNPIGPNQGFVGRVNGAFSSANIYVVCPGPVWPGRTGHPTGNQMLEVISPPPPVVVSVGNTGSKGTKIVARVAEDPSVGQVFTDYFVNKPIPTSLLLPCSGAGKVVFKPRPNSPTARSSVVDVTYINLAT